MGLTAVIARIILRYGAGALVALGMVSDKMGTALASDPDMLVLIGMALGAATESAYVAARYFGWEK